ncbi:hypothetical protein N8269_02845 [Candidatus Thioglobus sp.]|nr:hypothetical protein [Candidatus Thioglobus sp.]
MNIFKDKRFLKYFFVLAAIAVMIPPFHSDMDSIGIQFGFLLDPPRRSDGLSLSILSVEIIACFLLAHIINFIVTKTPKKYLFGIPIFLVLVFFSLMAYDDYAIKLQKKEEIITAIEKAKLRNNFDLAIECNVLIEEDNSDGESPKKKVDDDEGNYSGVEEEAPSNSGLSLSTGIFESLNELESFPFYRKDCDRSLPYVFGKNPTIIINKDTTVLDFNKATEEYINNIEIKFIEGLSITNTEKAFLGL